MTVDNELSIKGIKVMVQYYLGTDDGKSHSHGGYCAVQELLYGTFFTCCKSCIYCDSKGRKFMCNILERFK